MDKQINSKTNSTKRILIVEDDKWLADLYQVMLSRNPALSVSWAREASEALESLADNVPDLILLDMFLPGHSGIEFLHEIASYADTSTIPIVILSAVQEHDFAMNPEQWKHYRVVDYLYKPHIKPDTLMATINKQLLHTKETAA